MLPFNKIKNNLQLPLVCFFYIAISCSSNDFNAGFDLPFWSFFVKSYPFTTLFWVNKDENMQQIFLAHRTIAFLTVTKNRFIVRNYIFPDPTSIYLFEFSSTNNRMKWEIFSKLTIEAADVGLVFFLLTLNIFDTFLVLPCYI